MVADDPSHGELARRLDQIWALLAGLIGRNEYAEYQRGIERRCEEIQGALNEAMRKHESDEIAMKLWVSEELAKMHAKSQWKTTLWVSILPTMAAVVSILVTIWLKKG